MLCIYTSNCFLAWSVFVWYAIKIDIRPRPVSIFGDHSATHFLPRFLSFRFVGNTWIQRLTCSNHYPRVSHRTFGSRTQSISFERKSFYTVRSLNQRMGSRKQFRGRQNRMLYFRTQSLERFQSGSTDSRLNSMEIYFDFVWCDY